MIPILQMRGKMEARFPGKMLLFPNGKLRIVAINGGDGGSTVNIVETGKQKDKQGKASDVYGKVE